MYQEVVSLAGSLNGIDYDQFLFECSAALINTTADCISVQDGPINVVLEAFSDAGLQYGVTTVNNDGLVTATLGTFYTMSNFYLVLRQCWRNRTI